MKKHDASAMPIGCFWIGLVLFGIMGPLSWTLLRDAHEEWTISRLEPVPCTIVHARLDVFETTRTVMATTRRDTTVRDFVYTPKISYRIVSPSGTVDGNRFASRNYLEDLDGETARNYMKFFTPGARTTCYYDPDTPTRSALVQVHGDRRRYLLLIPGLIVAVVSGLVMVATIQDRGLRPVFGPVAAAAASIWATSSRARRAAIVALVLFVVAMIALSIFNTL
jgi:hypothetical protein